MRKKKGMKRQRISSTEYISAVKPTSQLIYEIESRTGDLERSRKETEALRSFHQFLANDETRKNQRDRDLEFAQFRFELEILVSTREQSRDVNNMCYNELQMTLRKVARFARRWRSLQEYGRFTRINQISIDSTKNTLALIFSWFHHIWSRFQDIQYSIC